MGANGEGKSTLVKLMLGDLCPRSGTALQHPQARIGVFAQSNVEDLVQEKGQLTALKHMKALFPEGERLLMHAENASNVLIVHWQNAFNRAEPTAILSS